MVKIGSQHRLPLLPVRRSTSTGYCGRMSNWTGTPRQLVDLAERTRDPESSWWFRYLMAFGAGATVMLLVLTR